MAFSEMTLVAMVAVAVINLILFYLIIRAAVSSGSETPKRMKHVWAQTELLIAIARKQGVDETTLKGITEHLR
jgi:hypothetical protein